MNAFRSVAFVLTLGGFAAAGGCRVEGVEGVGEVERIDGASHAEEAARANGVELGSGVARLMRGGQAPASVIVTLKGSADLSASKALATPAEKASFVYRALADQADRTQGALVGWLSAQGAKFRAFHVTNAVVVYDASPALVRQIAARGDVARIAIDTPFKLSRPEPGPDAVRATPEDDAVLAPGSNIVAAGAVQVWEQFGTRGEGVVVAGQDTGYDWTHPALRHHYRGYRGGVANHAYNWHDAIHAPIGGGSNPCGLDSPEPCDDDSHGTHTMGTIVGDDNAGNQVGMAPAARWIGCRNMDRGVGTPSTYIECFEWFLAPYPPGGNPRTDGDPTLAPDVINNSWGCPPSEGCSGQEIVPALQALHDAGVVVVVSAGNAGPSCGTIDDQPATISDTTLSVGAYNHSTGAIASFSSRGPSSLDNQPGPDVSAPGVNIRSSVPGGGYSNFFSGTSMASPHVVGEVALLLSADPSLKGNVDEITNLVRATSTGKTSTQTCGGVSGSAVPNNTFGYGTINAHAAVSARLGN
ncbi:MAG TPA: S8 family serine peptidase [Polyangiaceae bacterium]|nr:S8 family serine peptidase [Polyangiaceae bacterium]